MIAECTSPSGGPTTEGARQPRRPWIELNVGRARSVVESGIFQQHIGRTKQLAGADATARTALAAHLEQIGKIIAEQQRQVEARLMLAVILHADALVGRAAPEEDRAHDVQHIFLQYQPTLTIDIRIGQIHRERGIVVTQVRTQ